MTTAGTPSAAGGCSNKGHHISLIEAIKRHEATRGNIYGPSHLVYTRVHQMNDVKGFNSMSDVRVVDSESDLASGISIDLYNSWRALAQDGALPQSSDWDYLDHPHLLTTLCILKVTDDRQDLEVKFLGSHFENIIGENVTGRLISNILKDYDSRSEFATFAENSKGMLQRAIVEALPLVNGPKSLAITDKDHINFESLILPFAGADGGIDHLAIALDIETVSADDEEG